jgi:hypothetical protein
MSLISRFSSKIKIWSFKSSWLLCVLAGLTRKDSTFYPHSVFTYFVWIPPPPQIVFPYAPLIYCFLYPWCRMFTAYYGLYLKVKQITSRPLKFLGKHFDVGNQEERLINIRNSYETVRIINYSRLVLLCLSYKTCICTHLYKPTNAHELCKTKRINI